MREGRTDGRDRWTQGGNGGRENGRGWEGGKEARQGGRGKRGRGREGGEAGELGGKGEGGQGVGEKGTIPSARSDLGPRHLTLAVSEPATTGTFAEVRLPKGPPSPEAQPTFGAATTRSSRGASLKERERNITLRYSEGRV